MSGDEVLERRQQLVSVPPLTAQNGPVHVIGNHGADFSATIRSAEQILCQSCRVNFIDLLVLRERPNLFLGQPAQRNAVLQRNHGVFLPGIRAVSREFFWMLKPSEPGDLERGARRASQHRIALSLKRAHSLQGCPWSRLRVTPDVRQGQQRPTVTLQRRRICHRCPGGRTGRAELTVIFAGRRGEGERSSKLTVRFLCFSLASRRIRR
jgi:hypothetical protein